MHCGIIEVRTSCKCEICVNVAGYDISHIIISIAYSLYRNSACELLPYLRTYNYVNNF